jgi:hypothetical protein
LGHSEAEWDIFPPYFVLVIRLWLIKLTVPGLGDTHIAEMLINRKIVW